MLVNLDLIRCQKKQPLQMQYLVDTTGVKVDLLLLSFHFHKFSECLAENMTKDKKCSREELCNSC